MQGWKGLVRAVLLGAFLLPGCARFPDNPLQGGVRRFVIEMRVQGVIKQTYLYFVLFNLSNDASGVAGPIPVVAPPWGNGFAAGTFTHFVQIDAFGYRLFRVVPGTNQTVFEDIGEPVSATPITPGSTSLRFEFDLTQFIPDEDQARALQFIQVNFLNTDRIPLDPNDPNPKYWDALGRSDSLSPSDINSYLNIRIDQNRIFRNSDTGIEPTGDVRDPDLDIIDWRLEVRSI